MAIKIFQKEIDDGVGDLVKSTASIVYASQASFHIGTKLDLSSVDCPDFVKNAMALAQNKEQLDLFYLEAVLVSTGWNKNDDVFTAENTWLARNTPEDKQFNFMHDENDIIGHITGSYVLSKDGKAVSDEGPMPDEFDIITQAVLYNSWTQEDNRERMDKIIAEIKEGKWYVSMECLFSGFDYALIDQKGKAKILSRDESSSFLTKHLRAYGGTGEYEGYKIGRALSNISFSGKGLVSKPANPRSVILAENSRSTASFIVDTDSKLSIGEINMSADQSLLEKQLAETKAQLEEARTEVANVKAQIEAAKDKEFAAKISAYEVATKQAQATVEELNEQIKSTQARVAELEDALNTSKEALAKAEKDMEEMKKKEKMAKRKAALTEAGLDDQEVDETLASFEALDDTAFEAIAGMMKKKAGKKYTEDSKASKADASEDAADKALDDVDASQTTDMNVDDDMDDEVSKTQASVAQWFEKHVLNSK
jgi:hypothetical protein